MQLYLIREVKKRRIWNLLQMVKSPPSVMSWINWFNLKIINFVT